MLVPSLLVHIYFLKIDLLFLFLLLRHWHDSSRSILAPPMSFRTRDDCTYKRKKSEKTICKGGI
jgi:hypothetical protein